MMFNVPIPGGTTGHAVCGTLVAILFGPWPAVLAISIALGIQAFLFGDGGVLAFGANCFNMSFVRPLVGNGVYRAIAGQGGDMRRELVGAGIGSYVGINAAALCAGIEFGIQPLLFSNAAGQALHCPYPLWVSVPAMLLGHLTVFGAVEATFTVGILAYVRKVVPDLGRDVTGGMTGHPFSSLIGPVVMLVMLTPLGLLATGDAWGEWSAAGLSSMVGYMPRGLKDGWQWTSLLPDYSVGGLPDWAGYMLCAVIGVLLLIVVFRLIAASMRRRVRFGDV